MNTILIVVTLAISQGHMRNTEYWPVVTMQEFRTAEGCEAAARVIKQMAASRPPQTACVPKL